MYFYFKSRSLLFFLLLLTSFILPEQIFAQNKAKFKVTSRRKPPSCNGGGCEFKKGYVQSKATGMLDVVLFIQHKNGYWENKTYTREGPGLINLNLQSCDYTGNYYAYACSRNESTCKFPDASGVESMHAKKDQTPKFKITKITKDKTCLEGGIKTKFVKGYIYSPTGHQVEVTVFVEKNDGKWRKKHFFYFGTGIIDIDMEGCDLTGKYKSIIQYTE